MTDQRADKEPKMISTTEYAKAIGCDRSTVSLWCKTGKLPGAVKVKTGKAGFAQYRYLVPENAEPLMPYRGYERKQPLPPKEAPEEKKCRTYSKREVSLYIRKHCGTQTYRQIADALCMNVTEVRSEYDRLHELYGI